MKTVVCPQLLENRGLSPITEERLSEALAARNELVHRYFTTNIERMANLDEHGQIVKEIRSLRSTVRKSNKQLEPFIKGLAEALDGASIDEAFHEGKEKIHV